AGPSIPARAVAKTLSSCRTGAAAGSRAYADATLAGIDREVAAVDAGSHLVSSGVGIVVLQHFLGAGVELLRLIGVGLETGVGGGGGEVRRGRRDLLARRHHALQIARLGAAHPVHAGRGVAVTVIVHRHIL